MARNYTRHNFLSEEERKEYWNEYRKRYYLEHAGKNRRRYHQGNSSLRRKQSRDKWRDRNPNYYAGYYRRVKNDPRFKRRRRWYTFLSRLGLRQGDLDLELLYLTREAFKGWEVMKEHRKQLVLTWRDRSIRHGE